jgi:Cellulase (glycosyl hydrolase family 5)
MLRLRVLLCSLLACAGLGAGTLGAATPAFGSQRQLTFFQAPEELLNPATKSSTFKALQWLGVSAIRLEITWEYIAPEAHSKTKPNFEAANPASYDWAEYDAVIAEAKRLKWTVLLTVSAPAPRWATSNKQAPYVTRPDDQDFEEFMTAVARHYGNQVSMYAIWNEPNQPAFLRPQFGPKGESIAPSLYRGLYEYGYKGLQAGGLSKPNVLMGELQPTEKSPKIFKSYKEVELYSAVAPVQFMRETLCLNAKYRKAPTCKALPASGFSIHPYITAAGPYHSDPNPNDVTINTLGRAVQALGKAARAGAIKAGTQLYVTEFGVRTKPERSIGVSGPVQAEWDAISERLTWENPHVASFCQYLLKDSVLGKGPQTGLEKLNGEKKPLYYGFPVPLTVTPIRGGYSLWGFVRPAKKATTVTVLIQKPHSRSWQVLKKVKTGGLGYWTLKSGVRGSYWKVRWTSQSGTKYEGPPIKAT